MVGGNPLHDKYGFRYWNDPVNLLPSSLSHIKLKSEKGAFAEHIVKGNSGRLCGIVSCLIQATFASVLKLTKIPSFVLTRFRICGPEYISSVAAETENPRKILPKAFRSFVYRLIIFFVGSALCMGIVIPYNDTTLEAVFSGSVAGKGTSAA
jgi:amino acid transporter